MNDPDRATDTAGALAALRSASGSRPLRVVVATGSHAWDDASRCTHEASLRAAAGERVEVTWHDSHAKDLVPVGPVRLSPIVAGAADLVGVGSVEPHWFAGLTGAHKTLTVGVMAHTDIAASHALALDPAARPFALESNPVHRAVAAAVEALGRGRRVLAIEHCASRWFGGDPLGVLRSAAPVAAARWRHRVAAPLDFVVAVVDPPLSRSLYQAEKGIKNVEFAVKDGGTIVLDARCEDGVGPDRFVRLLACAPTEADARRRLAVDGYRLGDHKAVRWRALQGRGVRLALVAPGFPPEAAESSGLRVFATREEAAAALRRDVPATARGAIVEDAGHTVVEVAPA